MREQTRTDLRYDYRPQGKEREAVDEYLRKSSLFWNALVREASPAVDKYFEGSQSPQAADLFVDTVIKQYKQLVSKDEAHKGNLTYRLQVQDYQTLPASVLRNRFADFVKACAGAKERFVRDPSTRPSIPRPKSKKSNKSIRFPHELIELKAGGALILDGSQTFLEIPGFHPSQVEAPMDLAISSRTFYKDFDDIGQARTQETSYHITFTPAE